MAHYNKILCSNLPSLKRAIERTGTSPFELTIEFYKAPIISLERFDTIKTAISQRCRALTFEIDKNVSIIKDITSLTALERLSINFLEDDSDDMKHLLSVVTHTAKKLRHLDVIRGVSILPYSGFIARLNSVQVYNLNLVGPEAKIISKASTLEQLCLSTMASNGGPVQLDAALPALQRLGIQNPDFDNIHWGSYTRLTHLWLSIDGSNGLPSAPTKIFTFPKLCHLMLEGPWDVLRCINAPVLESLVLQNRQSDHGQALSALEDTILQPRSLEINIYCGEKGMIDILRGKWKNIELLRLLAKDSYRNDQDGIGETRRSGKSQATVERNSGDPEQRNEKSVEEDSIYYYFLFLRD